MRALTRSLALNNKSSLGLYAYDVHILCLVGLDESHFQEVLDNMTEEEMAAAVEVNNRRTEEYRQAGILPLQTDLPADLSPEDVEVEVFSSSTKKYTMVNGGMIIETDIENSENGVEMQPAMSMIRSDIEVGSTQSTASPSPSPASFVRVSTKEDAVPASSETSEAATMQREDTGLMESGNSNV